MADDLPISFLRCPITQSPLRWADVSLIRKLNERCRTGRLVNRGGRSLDQALDAGLIDLGSRFLYPVRNEIPTLVAEEAIPLAEASLCQDEGVNND